MPSPTITFRLSPYQITRGLQLIRQSEPDFQFTSLSQIVKTIYLDYLAKMSIGRTDEINPSLYAEIQKFIIMPASKRITLSDIIKKEVAKPKFKDRISEEDAKHLVDVIDSEKSIISSLSDFSPPKDWMED